MEIPTTQEIIEEAECLKAGFKAQDFQTGIGKITEELFKNKLNKIIRMLKCLTREVKLKQKKE